MKIIKQTTLQLLKRIWYQKHFSIIGRKIGIIKITKHKQRKVIFKQIFMHIIFYFKL